jgi:hypothetical protein
LKALNVSLNCILCSCIEWSGKLGSLECLWLGVFIAPTTILAIG